MARRHQVLDSRGVARHAQFKQDGECVPVTDGAVIQLVDQLHQMRQILKFFVQPGEIELPLQCKQINSIRGVWINRNSICADQTC